MNREVDRHPPTLLILYQGGWVLEYPNFPLHLGTRLLNVTVR